MKSGAQVDKLCVACDADAWVTWSRDLICVKCARAATHSRNSLSQTHFAKYLGDGKPASVKHEWATLEQAVSAICGAGGVAVIAHPMRYGFSATAKRNLFEEFKALGGQAIEVHSGNCDKNDRLNYALLAERYGLSASLGSDFHRPNDYSGGTLGACPELPDICKPVWHSFQAA